MTGGGDTLQLTSDADQSYYDISDNESEGERISRSLGNAIDINLMLHQPEAELIGCLHHIADLPALKYYEGEREYLLSKSDPSADRYCV